jgi:t-SNARE complex subunit (syntaxin)
MSSLQLSFRVSAAEVEAHVAALRSALAQHQAAVDRCDELGDAAERRAANAQARAHIAAVRGELRRRVQRLAKRFTDVLQKHGDGQKRRRRAQLLLVGGEGAGVEDADTTTAPPGAQVAAASSSASTSASTTSTAAGVGGGGGEAGVRQRRRVPMASGGVDVPSGQSSVLLHVKDYGQQRRAAEQVEATIFELSGMMHRISHSVAEQHELFSRIDVTLEESETALARAQAQLLQFWDALQGDRGFAVKLLAAVLLVALLMFYFFR